MQSRFHVVAGGRDEEPVGLEVRPHATIPFELAQVTTNLVCAVHSLDQRLEQAVRLRGRLRWRVICLVIAGALLGANGSVALRHTCEDPAGVAAVVCTVAFPAGELGPPPR